MKRFITFLTYLSAINGLLLFIRPGDRALNTLIWFPKMIGAALTPVLGVAGLLGALLGLVKGERSLALAGLLGAGAGVARRHAELGACRGRSAVGAV